MINFYPLQANFLQPPVTWRGEVFWCAFGNSNASTLKKNEYSEALNWFLARTKSELYAIILFWTDLYCKTYNIDVKKRINFLSFHANAFVW